MVTQRPTCIYPKSFVYLIRSIIGIQSIYVGQAVIDHRLCYLIDVVHVFCKNVNHIRPSFASKHFFVTPSDVVPLFHQSCINQFELIGIFFSELPEIVIGFLFCFPVCFFIFLRQLFLQTLQFFVCLSVSVIHDLCHCSSSVS